MTGLVLEIFEHIFIHEPYVNKQGITFEAEGYEDIWVYVAVHETEEIELHFDDTYAAKDFVKLFSLKSLRDLDTISVAHLEALHQQGKTDKVCIVPVSDGMGWYMRFRKMPSGRILARNDYTEQHLVDLPMEQDTDLMNYTRKYYLNFDRPRPKPNIR